MSCLTIRLATFFTLLAALPTWGQTYAPTAAGPRHFVRLNGYVFADYGWTASLPVTPKIAAANFYSMLVPIDLEQKYPQIVSPVNANTIAFNHAVRAYANSVWKLDGGPPQSDPTKDMIEDHELDYALNSDSLPGVISVTFVLSHFQPSRSAWRKRCTGLQLERGRSPSRFACGYFYPW